MLRIISAILLFIAYAIWVKRCIKQVPEKREVPFIMRMVAGVLGVAFMVQIIKIIFPNMALSIACFVALSVSVVIILVGSFVFIFLDVKATKEIKNNEVKKIPKKLSEDIDFVITIVDVQCGCAEVSIGLALIASIFSI